MASSNLGFIRFLSTRQLRGEPIRLSMNLLVKNEVDIIADNIKAHSKLGVDCFVVMDNGSDDGTREVLDELKDQYELLIIDRPVTDYQQSNWKTEMAFVSRDKLKADWSIANDADEFWIPKQGDLKSELSRWGSVIKYPRYNMQLDSRFYNEEFKYYQSSYRVQFPIDSKGTDLINNEALSIMLNRINGKVMVNNHGAVRIKGGNHRAWHLWSGLNNSVGVNVEVLHYPIRSKSHFIDHIENRSKLLKSGVTKMGDHYRRWVRLYEEGRIEEEIGRLVLSDDDIRTLKKFGVLIEDFRSGAILEKLLAD